MLRVMGLLLIVCGGVTGLCGFSGIGGAMFGAGLIIAITNPQEEMP